MKKKILKYLAATITIILIGWAGLTLYVEKTGPPKQWVLGNTNGKRALIIFDPDPFYNLDEQICLSMAKALAEQNINVNVLTVAAADTLQQGSFDVLIYCANTYNWRPDWSISNFIKNHGAYFQNDTPVIAITLGAGSTEAAKNAFEKLIINSGGKLVESYTLWLWRPNDESKIEEPNVKVAVSMAYGWGNELAGRIK